MPEQFSAATLREAIFYGLNKAVLISVTDLKGNILYINDNLLQLSGYARDELIGKSHRIFNSQFHPKEFFAGLWQTVNLGRMWNGEICNLAKNGNVFWVNSTISLYKDTFYVNVAVDISSKKNSEQQFLDTDNILRGVSQISPVCLYKFARDQEGKIKFNYLSEAAKKIFRISPEEVYVDSSKILSLIHPDDLPALQNDILTSENEEKEWTGNYRLKFTEDDITWIESYCAPQRHKEGSCFFHGTISDITARKNFEAELINRAKLAMIGEMASSIAHEINNPLSVIIAKADILKKTIADAPQKQEAIKSDVEKIGKMSRRISDIVRGLRSISRDASKDPFEKSKLSSIVDDSVELAEERFMIAGVELQRGKKIEIEIECRATQISQVILNLLNNACDAVENLDEKWVRLEMEMPNNTCVRICITDSGKGISSQITDKLMQPFFTTKSAGKGTGLGLSIASGIAKEHGGSLSLDTENEHTRFVFELPLKANKAYGGLIIR